MEKTVTITKDMEVPLILALDAGKRATEELRQFAAARGKEEVALMYEEEIRAMDQILELVRRAEWKD